MEKKIKELTAQDIASICDHTFLKRSECECFKKTGKTAMDAREEAFKDFLATTLESSLKPYAVCVRPEDVPYTKRFFENNYSDLVIASVVGFPDGSWYNTDLKIAETKFAIGHGASEIDMVLNYRAIRTCNFEDAQKDVERVTRAAHKNCALVKLIIEACELNSAEIDRACILARDSGVEFVKTSTGFGAYGAREDDLKTIKRYYEGGIKISGGVNKNNVYDLLMAASRKNGGVIDWDPLKIRIGESSLLDKLV